MDIFTEIELSMTDPKYEIWALFDFQSFPQRIPLEKGVVGQVCIGKVLEKKWI